jgi:hypothetical protein
VLYAKTINRVYGPSSPSTKAGIGEIWNAAVHPGLVESQLAGRVEGVGAKRLLAVFRFFGLYTDADAGSWTSVFCAASPQMKAEQSGTYFERIAKAGLQSSYAKDMDLAARLEIWTKGEMENGGWIS